MDAPFVYDKYVTGKNFIGRKEDCLALENILSQGKHVTIYAPPQSGKRSLIHQTLFNMKINGQQFAVCDFSMLNVRHTDTFLTKFGSSTIRAFASTPEEFSSIISTYLPDTHFVFEPKEYSENDLIVSTNSNLDYDDMEMMLSLPHRLAKDKEQHLIMIIDEFQNIDFTEDAFHLLKIFDKVIGQMIKSPLPGCSFIFTGSMVNAMNDIFHRRRLFYRQVENMNLNEIHDKEIIEYIVKGFLTSGKVIERELLAGICALFKNNLYYINHFISICDSLSKGYIMEPILIESLQHMLAIHEPRFKATVNNLTTHQLNLLKAILDGITQFSASNVIQEYHLNSSANVKRVKDALMKKEIITFDENDIPSFQDSLFEYWIRKHFFNMK